MLFSVLVKLTTYVMCITPHSSEWARRIIVAHKKGLDPEWMLESVIKVYNVMVEENPNQGMLSNSYLVQVCYKIADDLK